MSMIIVALSSCSVSRHLPNGGALLDEVNLISEHDSRVAVSLKSKVRQQPNTRTFGLFRLPLFIYSLSGDKDNLVNRTLRNIGEPPRVYNDTLTAKSCETLRQTLVNQGYLKAEVKSETSFHKHKAQVNYYIDPKKKYHISSIKYISRDSLLLEHIYRDSVNMAFKVGSSLDANLLDEERMRLAIYLQNLGYYDFKKDYITYIADTMRNSTDVNLFIRIRDNQSKVSGEVRPMHLYRQYRVSNVNYLLHPTSQMGYQNLSFTDTLHRAGENFLYYSMPFLRPKALSNASMILPGGLYSVQRVKDTYTSYGRLGALKYTNISFEHESDTTLRCFITLYPAKKISSGVELDVTNTAGDFGVSGSLSFTNRNLFRGAEALTVKLRGAYENITHLSDYSSDHFREYGVDVGLNFPRFIIPFVDDNIQRRSKATTQLDLQYNAQKRPEFERTVLSASWSYLWNTNRQIRHRVDLMGVNYVSVPYKNPHFIDQYLNQYNSKNSIMKFNYEDLFIFRSGYDFYYTSPNAGVTKDFFDISHSVRVGVEASGNIFYLLSNLLDVKQDSLGQYRFFNLAFTQYVKNDLSWTMNINFNSRNSLLWHIETGIAFPYGNSRMLPFEKRYYAGGANSVRGWSVRGLGPGSYINKNDGTIDYINQSGDIKLDLSLEYRMHLFWKFRGALFVDAGNIWTIYDYDDQPNGVFTWDTFYKQIAVAYGLGLRLDLNFLVLRFDMGMKAINPAYKEGILRYPIRKPNFGRDFAWHFAVGYPF